MVVLSTGLRFSGTRGVPKQWIISESRDISIEESVEKFLFYGYELFMVIVVFYIEIFNIHVTCLRKTLPRKTNEN